MQARRAIGWGMILALVVAAATLGACAAGDSRGKSLDNTLELYARTLRWGDLRAALQFLDPEQRPDARLMQFELKRFEQVSVTGYEVLNRGPGPAPDTVQQIVAISVANRHTAVSRTIEDRQVWRWDETDKRWWLTSGLPDLDRR